MAKMNGDPYRITLPDGSKENIPKDVFPVFNGRWCQTDTDASVETTAQALEKAEREFDAALARRDYLRGLMGRVIAAANKGPSVTDADGLPYCTPCRSYHVRPRDAAHHERLGCKAEVGA